MCPRSNTTFVKRQKELARQEKQRAKAERKKQRKAERLAGPAPEPELEITSEDEPPEQQEESL